MFYGIKGITGKNKLVEIREDLQTGKMLTSAVRTDYVW